MEDVRLKTADFELGGKRYILRCNNNVLADVQEAFGSMAEALSGRHSMRTALTFLAAMLNDWADEQGWPERFTSRSAGRLLPPARMHELDGVVMPLVVSSLSSGENGTETPQDAPEAPDVSQPGEDAEKNA